MRLAQLGVIPGNDLFFVGDSGALLTDRGRGRQQLALQETDCRGWLFASRAAWWRHF
jgi:hypothetical protein